MKKNKKLKKKLKKLLKKLIKVLENYGKVLNKQITNDSVIEEEKEKLDIDIFNDLMASLKLSNLVLADVTIPSLGVGYELGIADSLNKKVIAIYDSSYTNKVSTMIRGNKNIKLIAYKNLDEIINDLGNILEGEFYG